MVSHSNLANTGNLLQCASPDKREDTFSLSSRIRWFLQLPWLDHRFDNIDQFLLKNDNAVQPSSRDSNDKQREAHRETFFREVAYVTVLLFIELET